MCLRVLAAPWTAVAVHDLCVFMYVHIHILYIYQREVAMVAVDDLCVCVCSHMSIYTYYTVVSAAMP